MGRLGGGGQTSTLQPGQLVRQRARLKLPAGTNGASDRIYVGAYTLGDGARLPVSQAGAPPATDARYRLLTLDGK